MNNIIENKKLKMGNEQLPKGWVMKKLGEVGKVLMCKRVLKKQTSPTGEIPFYKIGTFGKKADAFITKKLYSELKEKYSYPKKGQILLSASGTIGRRVRFDGQPAFFQDSNIVWIDNDETVVSNDYLYCFYGFCDWNPSKGATIKRLYNDDLRAIQIPIPPLSEQKRIVSKLDTLFAEIEAIETKTKQNLENTKELFQSYLQAVFDPSTRSGQGSKGDNCGILSSSKWEKKKLGEVCEKVFAGGDKPKKFSKFVTDVYSVPIFANGEKNKGLYGYTNTARVFKPSITISGRGTIGYSEIRMQPFVPIVRLITLLPNNEIVDIKFLHYCIKNIDFSNSGSSIPQLTVPMMKEYKITFPSIMEQQCIVEKLDSLSADTKKLESLYQEKLLSLSELKKSILDKAFKGEL